MKMIRLKVRWSTLAMILMLAGPLAMAEPFCFIAIGCVPYGRAPDSRGSFLRLIAEINHHAPAFTVHLGDIMSSEESPTDEVLLKRRDDFNSFTGPLIYTPGDNEWTDSHTKKAGGHDPLERLAALRKIFFAEERSLGQRSIVLVTQRQDPRFTKFVENARWTYRGIVFATLHVVGSSNNDQPSVPGAVDEWQERDLANEAWIRATFQEARTARAPGVALFFQADPFAADLGHDGYAQGFERFLRTIEAEARAFAKPVLLVHADEHRYRLDVGVRFQTNAPRVENVTRVETFGEQNSHGVLVTVDPESADVFLAGPLVVPNNRPPQLPRVKKTSGD